MIDQSEMYGLNAGYILEQFENYLRDPSSVDDETKNLFSGWSPLASEPSAYSEANSISELESGTAQNQPVSEDTIEKISQTARLARFIRHRGHLHSHLDPLSPPPLIPIEEELNLHNLTADELKALPSVIIRGPIAAKTANAFDAIEMLRKVYSGTIGFDFEHIQIHEERTWLRNMVESQEFLNAVDEISRLKALNRLVQVDGFERYLQKTFPNGKRFSIEGSDMLVPILDEIIEGAEDSNAKSVILGMAHRGRLNVLANVLHKSYHSILSEFETAKREDGASVAGKGTSGWTGDVKYHKGKDYEYREMTISLVPNPSHLEFVNPVVEGHSRAAQEITDQQGPAKQERGKSLAILIHGDAAFPGQGVVAETLNMSQLPGYATGGTIHVIVNNQIGFTTSPNDGRSTHYSSDLAKGFEMPIVHVNGDDPVACIAVARMAHAYREKFHKDFLIDLLGYRRFGHNEGEDPFITQPQMYAKIKTHPRLRETWANLLIEEGAISQEQSDNLVAEFDNLLDAELEKSKQYRETAGQLAAPSIKTLCPLTSVSEKRLRETNALLYSYPEGFIPNDKLERTVIKKRREGLDSGLVWGHAEALAFATILEDGTPIRLSGQDAQPGTFSHRHCVLHDATREKTHTPLQTLPTAKASFSVYNSPLSENAILGFEYGYSMHSPHVLVLWEAQFGDFGNGAQVIIDQFLVSSYAKWQQTPSLVLLLPHGYEGQGPEHSNARPERFLQLCADDNIQVVNCTTPAQIFHVLRRQAALLMTNPRPLVIMTPKSLLKDSSIASSLSEFTHGGFRELIGDPLASENPERVTRLALCSGKVHVDLMKSPGFVQPDSLAVARIEQIYPFPKSNVIEQINLYPNLRELVWLQEEPKNMGAWSFIQPHIRDIYGEITYIGRAESASPAEGSKARHDVEQARILREVFTGVPGAPSKREVSRSATVSA